MKKYLLIFSFILFSFFSCSPIKIFSTDQASSEKFKTYKTFAFAKLSKRVAVNRANSESVKEYVEQAVVKEMADRGYTLVEDNPDFLVDLYTSVRDYQREQSSNSYTDRRGFYRYSRFGYTGSNRNQSRLETDNMGVVVNITLGNGATKSRIGNGEAEVKLVRNAAKSAGRLDEAIEKLVETLVGG